MKKSLLLVPLIGASCFSMILAVAQRDGFVEAAEKPSTPVLQEHLKQRETKIFLVEFFLSPERKSDIDAIKKEFEAVSITKVRAQAFRKGHPPQNVGFGKEIPADVARLAIRLALTYNDGIQFLLPEKRLAAHYIGIAVSIFDEAFQIPVSPEELKQLSDPTLTTDQFHDLYRQLTDKPPRINR